MSGISRRILELANQVDALKYGKFILSSGQESQYYFDGRRLTLHAEGSYLVGKAIWSLLVKAEIKAIGGPTLGADPIVTAVAIASHLEGKGINAFIVRKEAKQYGSQQMIEGVVEPGSSVAIVDDSCTTGGSIIRAIEAAEEHGCCVKKVLAILDRKEGGSEELKRRGYDFVSLLEASNDGNIRITAVGRTI